MGRVLIPSLTCEAHPNGCPEIVDSKTKKGVRPEILEFQWRHPSTGEPIRIELCAPEFDKYVAPVLHLATLSYADEEKAAELDDQRREAHDRIYADGLEKGREEGRDELQEEIDRAAAERGEKSSPYAPLFREAKKWLVAKGRPLPRGKTGKTSPFVLEFRNSPEGEGWKTWEPGDPIPTTRSTAGETPQAEQPVAEEEKPEPEPDKPSTDIRFTAAA
jgi:hypothetical protein